MQPASRQTTLPSGWFRSEGFFYMCSSKCGSGPSAAAVYSHSHFFNPRGVEGVKTRRVGTALRLQSFGVPRKPSQKQRATQHVWPTSAQCQMTFLSAIFSLQWRVGLVGGSCAWTTHARRSVPFGEFVDGPCELHGKLFSATGQHPLESRHSLEQLHQHGQKVRTDVDKFPD